jgi:hypothetical protein
VPIRICKSNKERRHNGQTDKRTKNDLQNTTQKTNNRVTRTLLQPMAYYLNYNRWHTISSAVVRWFYEQYCDLTKRQAMIHKTYIRKRSLSNTKPTNRTGGIGTHVLRKGTQILFNGIRFNILVENQMASHEGENTL